MSIITNELNEKSKDKKAGYIFLDLDEALTVKDGYYGIGFMLGVLASFFALSYFVIPAVMAGKISMLVYFGMHCSIAAIWTGVAHLIKKYKIQHTLINKGNIAVKNGE